MRQTTGRSARMRRRLTIGILVLALVTQALEVVNGVVELVAGVG